MKELLEKIDLYDDTYELANYAGCVSENLCSIGEYNESYVVSESVCNMAGMYELLIEIKKEYESCKSLKQ